MFSWRYNYFKCEALRTGYILSSVVLTLTTVSNKNYWKTLFFHKKVLTNIWLAQRYSNSSLPPYSMLCQAWKSYTRQCWPGMGKQTCSQHWIRRGEASLAIFVTVSKKKKNFEKSFLKIHKIFFKKSGLSLRGNYKAMFIN